MKRKNRLNEILLKIHLSTAGYQQVLLTKQGKSKTYQVHQLMAIAFLNHIPNGNRTVVMDKWQDYDEKQKEYADEFRELAKAYISLGADPTFIQDKATKKFKYEINSISDWWDYITRPE